MNQLLCLSGVRKGCLLHLSGCSVCQISLLRHNGGKFSVSDND